MGGTVGWTVFPLYQRHPDYHPVSIPRYNPAKISKLIKRLNLRGVKLNQELDRN